jgi:hypothetical protein
MHVGSTVEIINTLVVATSLISQRTSTLINSAITRKSPAAADD